MSTDNAANPTSCNQNVNDHGLVCGNRYIHGHTSGHGLSEDRSSLELVLFQ